MMRIGIFFGGKSREREVSFAGGRTVYDSLDKSLFEPVPVFVDSRGNFIHLDWHYLYKGSIRDFYPPIDLLPESEHNYQIYAESLGELSGPSLDRLINEVGRKIEVTEFAGLMDFAFLALHGPYGEDGTIQGILEFYDIPYSGAGIFTSATGINKGIQKKLFGPAGFGSLDFSILQRSEWMDQDKRRDIFHRAKEYIGFPLVIKSSSQGSSIGVSILDECGLDDFQNAVNRSFFIEELHASKWASFNEPQEVEYVRQLTDLQQGIGLPLMINGGICYHPEMVLKRIRELFVNDDHNSQVIGIESLQAEPTVVIEEFVKGREFSCIVIQDEDGTPVALPPTEIRKASIVFDYRAKYLPGISNKVTPIELPGKQVQEIRDHCEALFAFFNFNVYARIDGFITDEGKIHLNDPNTTSGMLPSSFFFHQAAEIGLTPSQFLTYITRTSVAERARNGYAIHHYRNLLDKIDAGIESLKKVKKQKMRVAVILGGYSSERHISVESGRNVFEKLSSSDKYEPEPVFLTGSQEDFRLYRIPVNILLKDNADDIRDKIESFHIPGIIDDIIHEAGNITGKYADSDYEFEPRELTVRDLSEQFDFAFLALHGRPGEDGTLQKHLEKYGMPYNGSDPESAELTIDKYKTNQLLHEHGIRVTGNMLLTREEWQGNRDELVSKVEDRFSYPFIAKPSDDGCSSAVKKITSKQELEDYMFLIFRDQPELPDKYKGAISIKPREEFPFKDYFIVEKLVTPNGAGRFLEITGGMLTHFDESGHIGFEVFEPSEALAGAGILSLEEKFLAGEGQNITPARFDKDPGRNRQISRFVKKELQKVAEIANVTGYCRIDAFVRIYDEHNVEVIIIEINSLPGLTPATAIFHQAALNGYKPVEFLDQIITFGTLKLKKRASAEILD